jgi:hypothetical protein
VPDAPAGPLPDLVESLSVSTMQSYAGFQPASERPADYGTIEKAEEDPTTGMSKAAFRRGVAMSHTFLLFAALIPPFMLCVQMEFNTDLQYFVGSAAAKIAYFVVLIILLVPMAHLTTRLHPWAFLLSVWVPCFIFVGIGWYYRDHTSSTVQALQSTDCGGFVEKRSLQYAYQMAAELYDQCGRADTYSIEECPQYMEVYDLQPKDFAYLKALEHRFQCAGICHSSRRLWSSAGSPAPACSLFAAQWVRGALIEAQFVLWYSVLVILASIPVFITLLDSFFKDYYQPLTSSK